jgi:hypothetical protein
VFRNFKESPNRWRQKGSPLEIFFVLNVFILGDFRDTKKYFRDFSTERICKTCCMYVYIYIYIYIYSFILNVWHFSFLLSLKISPNFELWPVCKYIKYMFESHISE